MMLTTIALFILILSYLFIVLHSFVINSIIIDLNEDNGTVVMNNFSVLANKEVNILHMKTYFHNILPRRVIQSKESVLITKIVFFRPKFEPKKLSYSDSERFCESYVLKSVDNENERLEVKNIERESGVDSLSNENVKKKQTTLKNVTKKRLTKRKRHGKSILRVNETLYKTSEAVNSLPKMNKTDDDLSKWSEESQNNPEERLHRQMIENSRVKESYSDEDVSKGGNIKERSFGRTKSGRPSVEQSRLLSVRSKAEAAAIRRWLGKTDDDKVWIGGRVLLTKSSQKDHVFRVEWSDGSVLDIVVNNVPANNLEEMKRDSSLCLAMIFSKLVWSIEECSTALSFVCLLQR